MTGLFSPINLLQSHSMSMSSQSFENPLEMRQIFLAIEAPICKAANAEPEFYIKQACISAQTAIAAHRLFLPRKSNLDAT